MKKIFTKLVISLVFMIPAYLFAQVPASQKVIVVEPGDGTLETAINSDVDGNGNRVNPNRVYQLKAGEAYKMLSAIVFGSSTGPDSTATLFIEGQLGGTLPIVYADPANGANAFRNEVYGSLSLKNIYFQVTAQNGTCNELFRQFKTNPRLYVENIIAEGEKTNDLFNFGDCKGHLRAYFKNSYFRDNTQFQNPWNFAVFSPGNQVLVDTLWVENCTVANAGLTFFGKTDPVKFCFFDHNTIINVPKYVFFFDQYLEGYFTNNVFVNCQWQGECTQMMVSQLDFQVKWGPRAAGVLNEGKEMDPIAWTDRFGSVPAMSEVQFLASNNLQFTSPFLDKYYQGGYDGNKGYPISYIDWGFLPKPVLPDQVYNVPPMFSSLMLDSLIAAYPTKMKKDNLVQTDPQFVTNAIKDQAEGDLYAQWARNNFAIPDVALPTADEIKANFAFGDMDPTTFPGVKTEVGQGVTTVQDFIEDFSYTGDIKSKIDGKPLGSLQWFPTDFANYDGKTSLEAAKNWLKTPTAVKNVTSDLSLNIYPNPTVGKVTIECLNSGNFDFKVIDPTGRMILSKTNIGGKTINIDLSGFSKGIYLIKVNSLEKSAIYKIVLK
jgi:hypothetical protein